MKTRLATLLAPLTLFLAACSDEGDDSGIFDGASILIVLVVVGVIVAVVLARRR